MNFRNILDKNMEGTEVLVHTRMLNLNTQDFSFKRQTHNLLSIPKTGTGHVLQSGDTGTIYVACNLSQILIVSFSNL